MGINSPNPEEKRAILGEISSPGTAEIPGPDIDPSLQTRGMVAGLTAGTGRTEDPDGRMPGEDPGGQTEAGTVLAEIPASGDPGAQTAATRQAPGPVMEARIDGETDLAGASHKTEEEVLEDIRDETLEAGTTGRDGELQTDLGGAPHQEEGDLRIVAARDEAPAGTEPTEVHLRRGARRPDPEEQLHDLLVPTGRLSAGDVSLKAVTPPVAAFFTRKRLLPAAANARVDIIIHSSAKK